MGLDIYFNKTRKEEVGYFRKVNFLVGFFSNITGEEVQNLSPIEITKEDCMELLGRCNAVLEHRTTETSEELLPTCPGFFFGNYEYDEYYYQDVESVKNFLEKKLLPMFNDLASDESITFEIWY